ncbi:LysR family transcriptional regulator [Shimia thalassica]|uniref:LysR family transcriptional regulator n=1 Tax=Shimia thalassica TaxID=1715693 RepID=UPI0026E3C641|nr:LysR family transcriptional regulator [Shimia thalassica]MDO6485950.1 LysR family transcriptional regulator [Shimia thalassica]MDO6800387.1 LysR family transcriptional regulator [Shimia thalassica]
MEIITIAIRYELTKAFGMIENKHIRSFLRVLDLGGFSRASRSLNIAQPALSQHVRRLEEQLGVTLLIRGPQGATPTQAGRNFATKARQILELVDSAERQFKGGADTLFGEVSLGLPGSVCPVLATPVIVEAKRRFPNIRLLVSELMSGDLADMLREGRMDIAILFNVAETDDFTSCELAIESLHLVGAAADPALSEGTVSASLLSELAFVGTRPPHGLRLLIERWSNETGISLSVDIEANSPAVLIEMAAQGACYSILAPAAIQRDVETGHLSTAQVVDPPIKRTACLCSSKRLAPDPARKAIHDLVHQIALNQLKNGTWEATPSVSEQVN